jgi:hypothetical protein
LKENAVECLDACINEILQDNKDKNGTTQIANNYLINLLFLKIRGNNKNEKMILFRTSENVLSQQENKLH